MSSPRLILRLLVRYCAVNPSFKIRRGILGQAHLQKGTAEGLRDTTLALIRRFCTPGWARPQAKNSNRAKSLKLDEKLMEAVVSKIEVFAADGAADEQKAGRLLMEVDAREAFVIVARTPLCSLRSRLAPRTAPARPCSRDLPQETCPELRRRVVLWTLGV